MWHISSIILWFTCVQSQYPQRNPYIQYNQGNEMAAPSPQNNNRGTDPRLVNPGYLPVQSQKINQYQRPYQSGVPNIPSNYNPYSYGAPLGYFLRGTESPQRLDVHDLLDLDYASSESDQTPGADPRQIETSYYEELQLVEHFGIYLKRRTRIDSSSVVINDSAHQYNALFAVLISLARAVRNACTDFNEVYDQIYYPSIETYYQYGLVNAEKVATSIDGFIQKGNSRIPRILKLKEEICENELFCAAAFDAHINNAPLLYVKELETLEALAYLARSFYPYMEEFNQAALKGSVLQYLQMSKDRLKPYIMHVINSVEHISDRPVVCT